MSYDRRRIELKAPHRTHDRHDSTMSHIAPGKRKRPRTEASGVPTQQMPAQHKSPPRSRHSTGALQPRSPKERAARKAQLDAWNLIIFAPHLYQSQAPVSARNLPLQGKANAHGCENGIATAASNIAATDALPCSMKTAAPVAQAASTSKGLTAAARTESANSVELSSPSGGAPLTKNVRHKMEHAFSTSFDEVRVHHGAAAADIGARALAIGNHIYFASGQYAPQSQAGQELLGHELTHVMQQRAGRVASAQHKGSIILITDPALEAEADRFGKAAAQGQIVNISGADSNIAIAGQGIAQGSLISWLVKMGAKKVSKGTLKNFVKTQIKGKLKKIANKDMAKRFAKEADDVLSALEDPWWATAIGFVPIVGDAFDLGRLPIQIKKAFTHAERLEQRVERILKLQRQKAADLLPATLKRGKSYSSELEDLTYGQIVTLSKSDNKAAKMKKLIEAEHRLMGKL